MKALTLNYLEELEILSTIAECPTKPESVCRPLSLIRSLDQLGTVLLCKLWNAILTKVNIVSKALQGPGIKICKKKTFSFLKLT